MLQKVDGFLTAVQDWNRTVFGNIFTRKRRRSMNWRRLKELLIGGSMNVFIKEKWRSVLS